jgi:hypothetical protein
MATFFDRFAKMREEGLAATRAANKPNMLGVRPQNKAYESAPTPLSTVKDFVENRRVALRSPQPKPTVPTTLANNVLTPSSAEDAVRRSRMPVNTIARPEGVANIQRGTEVVEAPITNMQQAERARIAGIKGRISPENPYGADVVGGNMRTGQVQGISTQEQADRNLQSRFEQDANANKMAASFDRSTEALRDLRAERMGIPRSQLDIREGRVAGSGTAAPQEGGQFGDEILDRDRFLRQFQAAPGSLGGAKRRAQANTIAAQQMWDANQQAMQRPVAQAPTVNPLDEKRLLVDMQNNAARQGVDRERLLIDKGNLQNQTAKTSLEEKKQDIEAKSVFTENFSIGKEGAPDKELATGAWEISKATGVPAEIVQGYMQRSDFDWKNGPPANMTKYLENITAQITRDHKG